MRIEIDKEEYKDLIETKEEFLKTVRKLDNITIENIKLTDKLQEKEQECEELIGQRDKLEFGNNILEHERNKYKQALDEIKEIAEKTLNMVDYKTYFKRDNKSLKQEGFKALNEILQKISECEANNDR